MILPNLIIETTPRSFPGDLGLYFKTKVLRLVKAHITAFAVILTANTVLHLTLLWMQRATHFIQATPTHILTVRAMLRFVGSLQQIRRLLLF